MDKNYLKPWNWLKHDSKSSDMHPIHSFRNLQNQIDHMFNDTFREIDFPSRLFQGSFEPIMNVSETDKSYEISTEIPGVKKEDIHVEIQNQNLVISGEKKEKINNKDESSKIHHVESYYGQFYRSLLLPENAQTDNISAKFENGVLHLSIPKITTTASAKRIIIQ